MGGRIRDIMRSTKIMAKMPTEAFTIATSDHTKTFENAQLDTWHGMHRYDVLVQHNLLQYRTAPRLGRQLLPVALSKDTNRWCQNELHVLWALTIEWHHIVLFLNRSICTCGRYWLTMWHSHDNRYLSTGTYPTGKPTVRRNVHTDSGKQQPPYLK